MPEMKTTLISLGKDIPIGKIVEIQVPCGSKFFGINKDERAMLISHLTREKKEEPMKIILLSMNGGDQFDLQEGEKLSGKRKLDTQTLFCYVKKK